MTCKVVAALNPPDPSCCASAMTNNSMTAVGCGYVSLSFFKCRLYSRTRAFLTWGFLFLRAPEVTKNLIRGRRVLFSTCCLRVGAVGCPQNG